MHGKVTGYRYKGKMYKPEEIASALAADGWPVSPGEIDNAGSAGDMVAELAGLAGMQDHRLSRPTLPAWRLHVTLIREEQ